MKFLNNIDDTYKNADIPNKQRLLRMTFEEATYDTETEVLRLKLKPIFQALRILKDNAETHSKKVATQSKVSNEELLQILSKNIEISLKNEVTTLKKLSIIEKEPTNETLSVNGAPDGMISEPEKILNLFEENNTIVSIIEKITLLLAA